MPSRDRSLFKFRTCQVAGAADATAAAGFTLAPHLLVLVQDQGLAGLLGCSRMEHPAEQWHGLLYRICCQHSALSCSAFSLAQAHRLFARQTLCFCSKPAAASLPSVRPSIFFCFCYSQSLCFKGGGRKRLKRGGEGGKRGRNKERERKKEMERCLHLWWQSSKKIKKLQRGAWCLWPFTLKIGDIPTWSYLHHLLFRSLDTGEGAVFSRQRANCSTACNSRGLSKSPTLFLFACVYLFVCLFEKTNTRIVWVYRKSVCDYECAYESVCDYECAYGTDCMSTWCTLQGIHATWCMIHAITGIWMRAHLKCTYVSHDGWYSNWLACCKQLKPLLWVFCVLAKNKLEKTENSNLHGFELHRDAQARVLNYCQTLTLFAHLFNLLLVL